MTEKFKNPFSNAGVIVHKDRFYGRKNDLEQLKRRIIDPEEPQNTAIFGLPRIGKSSLVYKAVLDNKDILISKKTIPIRIDLSDLKKGENLFEKMKQESIIALKELGIYNSSLERKEVKNNIELFFKIVKLELKFNLLFILDEFDSSTYIFKDDKANFSKLRNLTDSPDSRVYYIIISRRPIWQIEKTTVNGSTLNGVFPKQIYLKTFDNEDLSDFFQKFLDININLKDDEKDFFRNKCGGHPFLQEILAYQLVEDYFENNKYDLEKIALNTRREFIDQYNHFIQIMKDHKRFDAFLQILFGPVYNATEDDFNHLLSYDLIKEEKNNITTFSNDFYNYLSYIQKYYDLWPLLYETERNLRLLINYIFESKYGPNWIEIYIKKFPTKQILFDKAKETMIREEKTFKRPFSDNILDYLYYSNLWEIMFQSWQDFMICFNNKDKNSLREHNEFISKVRNPLAHHRHYLTISEQNHADELCKEVLNYIKPFIEGKTFKIQ